MQQSDMIVEFELITEEKNEALVMEKVLETSKLLKQLDFKINSTVIRGGTDWGSDDMSEMGEMESLRLQMAMDRMSKMMSTLSNLLKKMADTAEGIAQNLK